MGWCRCRVWFPLVLALLVVLPGRAAAAGGLCPLDGKEYAADVVECPEHRIQLVRAEDLYRDPLTGMAFRRVEGGCFKASAAGGGDREECVDTFWLGIFEVTQAQWQQVMQENLSQFKECGPDCPAENVSFIDAREIAGHITRLGGATCRLPTEAEWEYAARGGRRSQGYRYSGSNEVDAVAWYSGNSGNKTHPVGRKQPNELGLYDMSGNVWEWVEGRFETEVSGSGPQGKPRGGRPEASRVIRGGSWISGAPMTQPEYRTGNPTGSGNSSLGVRLVAVP